MPDAAAMAGHSGGGAPEEARAWWATFKAPAGARPIVTADRIDRGEAARRRRHPRDYVSFTSAIGLLAAMAEAGVVGTTLAFELLTKLQRVGRYDAGILEDVARRIRAAAPSTEGGSPS